MSVDFPLHWIRSSHSRWRPENAFMLFFRKAARTANPGEQRQFRGETRTERVD